MYRYTHKLFSEQGDELDVFPHVFLLHTSIPPQSLESPRFLVSKAAACALLQPAVCANWSPAIPSNITEMDYNGFPFDSSPYLGLSCLHSHHFLQNV